jgi:hypothetical protein
MWIPDGAEAPMQSNQTIARPKRMLTVFWSPLGFLVVKIMPKGQHFDAHYFMSIILSVMAENRPMQTWEDQNRKWCSILTMLAQTRFGPELGT